MEALILLGLCLLMLFLCAWIVVTGIEGMIKDAMKKATRESREED